MERPRTLKAFSQEERLNAHKFLASRVATMMGRKLEEDDWNYVYCSAKDIPSRGWSNLNIDVMYNGLGVEHKMLCVPSKKPIKEYCGTSRMHPSATRSFRIPSTSGDPTEAAQHVLDQYADLIEQRRKKVAEEFPDFGPDMRTGWLLWQESLREFLYFEEEMLPPDPDDYYAEWRESGGGTRKTSKNLWIYEKETGRKRYSITTTAGQKIQPYFDVPPPNDPNLYYFCVQGEELEDSLVRVWLTPTTALLLKNEFGSLDKDIISNAIIETSKSIAVLEAEEEGKRRDTGAELAQPIFITVEAYRALRSAFEGVSDEHLFQLFARNIYQR